MPTKQISFTEEALSSLREEGFYLLKNVFDSAFLETTRQQMYSAQEQILQNIGKERLDRAGEMGVLRLMIKYQPHFAKFLETPEMLAIVDAFLAPTAILHLQNGFILPPFGNNTPSIFQNTFHMDFPRVMNGYVASVNIMVCIDDFTSENGATLVIPGSHQKGIAPTKEQIEEIAIPIICPAGSIFIFDSTLWHAAGINHSKVNRLAINHQFTRSFIKPQLDYVRALGEEKILQLPERSQQLLGYYSRVPASLDEFYQPEEKRFYRRYQG